MSTETKEKTRTVSLDEAPAQLAELVRLAAQGAEVLITENGTPLARLVPAVSQDHPRIAGLSAGKAWMSEDFNAELPDEFWLGKE
jgi:prevent-host-death family protein